MPTSLNEITFMPQNDLQRAAVMALTAAGSTALKRWVGNRRPRVGRLLRGAAAGAGAAGLLAAYRALTRQHQPASGELVDEIFSGAGKGVIYTAILDPLLPGPPLLRGAALGTAEYLAAPWGGLLRKISHLSPVERIPIVGALLDAGEAENDPFLAYLLFGVALGLLSGDDETED
ncbi:hypothetical protein BH23GEM11_BH23GEM11_04790 [soil metagenome]